jgi:transcriptional regulator with XRE-family HTH domain
LVAELLDDVHHHPDVFVESRSTAPFLEYAVAKLFDGKSAHLAKHIGVSKSEIHGWMRGKFRPSLPRLVLIAYCCGCGISDVLLANKVKLRKVPRSSTAKCLSKKTRAGSFRQREELLADLEKIVVELGTEPTLRAAARLLDVSDRYLRQIAPDIAAMLVTKGKEARHAACVKRAEQRFECFRRSYEELTVDGAPPPLYKVRKHVYLRNKIKLGFAEGQGFLRRIRQLDGGV